MVIGAKQKIGQPTVAVASHVDDGEVQHVDHLSVQPSGVMEDLSVKHAVDDVAEGTCGNEGEAEQHAELGVFLCETEKQKDQCDDRYDPECAKQGLHQTAAAHPTEGHAWILDEEQLEPVAQHRDFLTKGHVSLYPDLQDLIKQQYDENDDERPNQAFPFGLSHFLFFSFILASKQIVVVGTQRSLSFGMSLPVARQMP